MVWNSRFGESVGRVAAGFSLGMSRLLFLSFVLDASEHNMKGRGPGIENGLVLLLVAFCSRHGSMEVFVCVAK